jgi:hypothetical protein
VRIWVDCTAPAHPIVFRPIVERLRAAGHEVDVTARDYAQTLALARRLELGAMEVGRHGGASRFGKLASLAGRTSALLRWARPRKFDVALAHGSNDLALVAKMLGIPAANTFDYEFATVQHNIGCRFARRVVVPDAIPPDRLKPYGVGPEKLRQYPGLKEEYYLSDFEPDEGVLDRLAVDRARLLITVRPPPDVSLYHRKSNPLFPQVLSHIGHDPDVHAVVLPRTEAQRGTVRALGYPSLIVPDGAEDGQSLVALADLVISAGGTMNREAVALGTPVYTTFEGRLGAVDERLLREGRLRRLTDASEVRVERRHEYGGLRVRRDPRELVTLLLSAAAR